MPAAPTPGSAGHAHRPARRGPRAVLRAGYDAVGVREIAAEAGVNAALVNRYFGSKLGLFEAAVADSFTVGNLLVGDRATLGERLARYLVGRRRAGFDPDARRAALVGEPRGGARAARGAGRAGRAAARGVARRGRRARAGGLIVSPLFGIAAARDVLGVAALAPSHAEALVPPLGPLLQRLIDGA